MAFSDQWYVAFLYRDTQRRIRRGGGPEGRLRSKELRFFILVCKKIKLTQLRQDTRQQGAPPPRSGRKWKEKSKAFISFIVLL